MLKFEGTRRFVVRTASATLVFTAAIGVASAQDFGQLPAVSAPNGKVRIGGFSADGSNNDDGLFEVRGSFTAPVTYSTGFQIDGVIASVEGGDKSWGAVAGHYFWRDPSRYLLGIYAEGDWYDDVNFGTLAGEAEAYFGQFTLTSVTGVQFGDFDSSFFTNSYVNYYPDDDIMVGVGFRNDYSGAYFQAKAEYQLFPEHSGMSVYADGKWGGDGNTTIFAGVRFHFGAPKSLIRRHREDDPGDDTPSPNAGLKYDKEREDAAAIVPPPPPPGGGGGED